MYRSLTCRKRFPECQDIFCSVSAHILVSGRAEGEHFKICFLSEAGGCYMIGSVTSDCGHIVSPLFSRTVQNRYGVHLLLIRKLVNIC
jgi:hypothetical protein